MYPSFVILYSVHFEGKPFCCPCIRKSRNDVGDDVESNVIIEETKSCGNIIISNMYVPTVSYTMKIKGHNIPVVAIGCVTFMVGLFFLMGSFALKLDTPTEQDDSFGSNHMFSKFMNDYDNLYAGGDNFLPGELIFGLQGINRDRFERFNPSGYRGIAVLDSEFDIAPKANQQFILDVCSNLKDLSCIPKYGTVKEAGCRDSLNRLIKSEDVDCFMEVFHEWHDITFNGTQALDLGDANRTLFYDRLKQFSLTYDGEKSYENKIGFMDNKIAFVAIPFTTTMKMFQSVAIKEPVFSLLDQHVEGARSGAPIGLQSVFQTNFDQMWTQTEKGIVTGMYNSSICCFISYNR